MELPTKTCSTTARKPMRDLRKKMKSIPIADNKTTKRGSAMDAHIVTMVGRVIADDFKRQIQTFGKVAVFLRK